MSAPAATIPAAVVSHFRAHVRQFTESVYVERECIRVYGPGRGADEFAAKCPDATAQRRAVQVAMRRLAEMARGNGVTLANIAAAARAQGWRS